MSNISIDNLKHFIAVVEHKGINRAADRIALSPSSLTRSIHGIEDQIGKKVFDRIGRRVVLNSAGQELYMRAKRVIQDFHTITQGQISNQLRGHYQIGASHFLCRHFVAKKLAAKLREHPQATFDLFSMDTSALVGKLLQGSLDFGVGISPRVPDSIQSTTLASGMLYLCASKHHALAKASFAKLRSKLAEYPAIMHRPTESVERCDNHPMFKAFGIRPKIQLYWDSDDVAAQMLAEGSYWTMLPDIAIEANPGVKKLQHPANWFAPYEITLMHNRRRTSDGIESFFR